MTTRTPRRLEVRVSVPPPSRLPSEKAISEGSESEAAPDTWRSAPNRSTAASSYAQSSGRTSRRNCRSPARRFERGPLDAICLLPFRVA